MSNDFESSDFKEQKIEINSDHSRDVKGKYGNQTAEPEKEKPKEKGFVEQQKETFARSLMQNATEQVTKSWIEKCLCCLEFLKKYFNVTTSDVRSRLLNSLIPFNPNFYEISEKTPDLYGPFWIYTTLVFVIAAAGSLSKYIQGVSTRNFFQEFVPIAAGIIYGVGFGLPLVLTIFMKIFGSETAFISVLCTYGYSFTIFIPIVLVCAVPVQIVQWVLIAYAVFSATSLILVNYWKELSKYMQKKRYFLILIILCCQVGLFFLLKLYFFARLTNEIQVNLPLDNSNGTSTNATATNTTNSTNGTLLF